MTESAHGGGGDSQVTAVTPDGGVTLAEIWRVILDIRDRAARSEAAQVTLSEQVTEIRVSLGEHRRAQDRRTSARDVRCVGNEAAISALRDEAARRAGAGVEGRRLVALLLTVVGTISGAAGVVLTVIWT